jgi:hypothetical protein
VSDNDGRRASDPPKAAGAPSDSDQRTDGVVVDLERLEKQAEELYLHRFVEQIKKVRGDHGRYLTLRAGDETAIEAAGDGSAQSLKEVIADPAEGPGAQN